MSPADMSARVVRSESGRRSLTVDIHCHVLTVQVERLVADRPEKQAEPAAQLRMYGAESVEYNRKLFASLIPQLTDIDERLRRMDAMRVDVQVISPSPNQYYYWADVDLAKADQLRIHAHGVHPSQALADVRKLGRRPAKSFRCYSTDGLDSFAAVPRVRPVFPAGLRRGARRSVGTWQWMSTMRDLRPLSD